MTDTPEAGRKALAAILDGLEGVTPGPWKFTPHYKISAGGWGKIADEPTPNRYMSATMISVGYKGREVDDYWLSIKDANAAHLARCDPDTFRAIAALVEAQDKRIAELETALARNARGVLKATTGQDLSVFFETAIRFPMGTHLTVEHDGFAGTVIGYYRTRESRFGLNLQLDNARVVHVYSTKWFGGDNG